MAGGENLNVRIIASQVTNSASQAMAADRSWSFTTVPSPSQITPISAIQGTDGFSRWAGAQVSVEGIVTGSFQGLALRWVVFSFRRKARMKMAILPPPRPSGFLTI